jgi:hypothetical protein
MQRPISQVETFAAGAGNGYVARRAFDPQVSLFPDQSPFIGGFEFWNFRMPPSGVLVALLNRDGRPSWRIRGNASTGSRYFGLWLLPQRAFHGGRTQPLSRFASISVRIGTNNRNHFAVRFVIQAAGRYYLSRGATDRVGRFNLFGSNLSEQLWANYEPAKDLRANTSPEGWTSYNSLAGGASLLTYSTPTSMLGDVQAVGLYAEAVDCSSSGDRCLEWDELHATVKS